MTTAKNRAAFSLLELMIAIMILGIGMVMVATVFPVGLDISRETIQMNLTQAVTDAALATLRIKVPVYKELDQVYPSPVNLLTQTTHRVLVPDVINTDLDTNIGPEDDEVINGLNILPAQHKTYANTPFGYPNWVASPPGMEPWIGYDADPTTGQPLLSPQLLSPSAQSWEQFIGRTRVFTERTGWAGEMNLWTQTSVVPAQNLRPNCVQLIPDYLAGTIPLDVIIPTMIAPAFVPKANFPRVHLADQVYPPVPTTYENKSGAVRSRMYDNVVPVDPDDSEQFNAFITELASRRYSWTAIHHRISTEQGVGTQLSNRDMLTSVVITHRADMNERYARQKEPDLTVDPNPAGYNIDFGLNPADPVYPEYRQNLLKPYPDDDPDTDMLFPRPWLVMLNQVNATTGEIGCTGEVARLLPVGSYFIVAETDSDETFYAGTPHKIKTCTWDASNLNASNVDDDSKWARLEIARGGGGTVADLLVWVFPPSAIRNTAGIFQGFKTRSPVVGVALRVVKVPQ